MSVRLPAVEGCQLAEMLGVTPKEVYDLTKAGVIHRGEGRLYSVEDSVRRYCEWLRQQAAGAELTGGSEGVSMCTSSVLRNGCVKRVGGS